MSGQKRDTQGDSRSGCQSQTPVDQGPVIQEKHEGQPGGDGDEVKVAEVDYEKVREGEGDPSGHGGPGVERLLCAVANA